MKYLTNKNNCFITNIFLLMYLFGFLVEGFSKIKNIGLYGAILFFIVDIFMNKNEMIKFYKQIYINNKFLINIFIFFILFVFFRCLFPFSNRDLALHAFKTEFLNNFIFFIMSIFYLRKIKYLISFFIISFFIFVIKYGYGYYIIYHLNFSNRLERNFVDYFEFFLPMMIISFFYIKNKLLKITLSIVLIVSLFEFILTGARGAWGTIIVDIFLMFMFVFIYKHNYRKKIVFVFTSILIIVSVFFIYLYNNSDDIKYKIKQGFNPNGRICIIEDRLPIFLKNGNSFIGIGGVDSAQYIEFLNKYNAPKRYGVWNNGQFRYSSDEPFLLNMFYKYGILGLGLFLVFSLCLFKNIIKAFIYENNYLLFGLGIAFFGYFFVGGLFEGRGLKYLVIYFALYLIIKDNYEYSLYISRKTTS